MFRAMSEVIERLNAALEGRYTIERELGEGGMATVFLAQDERHARPVAIKVLKPELAAVIGGERFLTEITTTAKLQHPHILPLFDSGEADGFLFYVMPYVEGESLRERLDQEKQLGVEESLRITTDVADALHYAHRQGVIHRDIKPANILLHDGRPVVADFGIAVAISAAGGGRLTETGMSVGTPHYMSPEQATAERDLSPRSDVYSLACVLYEMLAGDPPHVGPTAQAVLMRILTEDPRSVTDFRKAVPPHVSAVIAKALEKLPADRFESAAEFASALGDDGFTYARVARTKETAAPTPVVAEAGGGVKRSTFLAVAGLAAAAVAVAAWGWLRSPPGPATSPVPLRTALSDFEISSGGGQKLAISRDGSKIAVTTNFDDSGPYRLFVRDVDQLAFREIEDTEGSVYPTFSPNGEWLAFSGRSRGLSRVQVSGGPVLPVADGSQGHWGVDETIVFRGPDDGLYLVSPAGGDATPIVDASSGEGALVLGSHPHLLPDGEAVLYEGRPVDGDNRPLRIVELESGLVTDLGILGNRPQYSASGHLLYGHSDAVLMAVPFDLDTHQVTGDPSTVLLDVTVGGVGTAFVVSETGTAFYRVGGASGAGGQRLLEVGLDGSEEPMPLEPREFLRPRWSPDGAWVAYEGTEPGAEEGESDIYLYNVDLGFAPTRLTTEGDNWGPVWSPDGTRIAFVSDRGEGDGIGLFMKTLGDAPAELILSARNLMPTQWLFDDLLVFNDGRPTRDLWHIDPFSDTEATLYADEEALLGNLQVSPNGSLATYTSNQSGRSEVYVRAFPDPGQANAVSRGGGNAPFWAPDGNTLYYWTLGGASAIKHVVAAQIDLGPPFTVTSVDTLITGAYRFDSSDLHPDGDRIIVSQEANVTGSDVPAEDSEAPRHFIVVNWFEELKERLGGN